MLLSPRCFSFQGKAAIRALKLGLVLERCDAPIRGANLRAINVADESRLASMAFPSLRRVSMQRSTQLVNERLLVRPIGYSFGSEAEKTRRPHVQMTASDAPSAACAEGAASASPRARRSSIGGASQPLNRGGSGLLVRTISKR